MPRSCNHSADEGDSRLNALLTLAWRSASFRTGKPCA